MMNMTVRDLFTSHDQRIAHGYNCK